MNLAIVTDNQYPHKLGRVRAQFPHWGENIGRSLPSGQQMLAKSKTKDVGSAGKSSAGSSGGRSIREFSDALAERDQAESRFGNGVGGNDGR